MTSEAKIEANRRNAAQSTGPRSREGKATAARNAMKHSILATNPVVPRVESREAWKTHRAGVLEALSPVGHVEDLLAERVALLFWRLDRVSRYERGAIASGLKTIEADLSTGESLSLIFARGSLSESIEEMRAARVAAETLYDLPQFADDRRLERRTAAAAIWACYEAAFEEGDRRISVPGVPDEDQDFDDFNLWTAGLIRAGLQTYAQASGTDPEALRKRAFRQAREKFWEAQERVIEMKREILRIRSERTIPSADAVDKIVRYEGAIERSLLRTMHELNRLQAARRGQPTLAPVAVDVDVSGGLDTFEEIATTAREGETRHANP